MGVMSVNDGNFAVEVLKADLPVLVDFWAEWCGPCKMIAPVVEEVAAQLAGKVKVVKVNVDEAQNLAAQHSIMSIPTLMIFKDGQVVEQMVGAMGKDQLIKKVSAHI